MLWPPEFHTFLPPPRVEKHGGRDHSASASGCPEGCVGSMLHVLRQHLCLGQRRPDPAVVWRGRHPLPVLPEAHHLPAGAAQPPVPVRHPARQSLGRLAG